MSRNRAKERTKGGPITELGAMRMLDPEGFAKRVRAAMVAEGGSIGPAAERLGVSRSRLSEYLRDPVFSSVKHAPVGRPPEKTRGKRGSEKSASTRTN